MKILTILVFAAGFLPGYSQTVSSPEEIGKGVILELLSRPDFMMYHTETVRGVHYAEACSGFGAARLAGLLNEKDFLLKLRLISQNCNNRMDCFITGWNILFSGVGATVGWLPDWQNY